MAINDFNIGFLGKLDGARSKNQINQDIEALKKSLNSLEIKATLDPKQTQALTKQLNLLQVSLSDASFSPKALNDLVSQVNNALKGIQISNINTSAAGKSATQAGQQIGKLVSDSAEKAISGVSSKSIGKYFRIDPSTSKEFENQMKGLVSQWTNAKGEMTDLKINTKTVYDKDSDASFERLHQATVTYKNDLDEVTKKTIAWRQIGTTTNAKGEEEAIRGFVEVSGQYSKALEKASVAADTFADKQLKLKTSLSDSLNSIKSSVADQNTSKPIKDQGNISSLQTQYQVVEQAIANVGSASKSTYAQMEADARTQISVLQDMVKQYRNAENVATSLRTKDFATVKDVQVQKLQEFKDRIAGSNVSITQMQTDLNNLDTALNGAFDAKTLTDYLNQLDVAQAKFKQLNTQIASTNRNEKVQIKVDGLQSNINEFAQLSTEAKNFKTTINGVEVSVQSLNSDLANVKSQGDFSVVSEKWKAYANAAKAAGYSINSTTANVTKFITENRRLTTLNSFTGWVKKNSAASKTFATDINSIFDRLRNNLNMTDKEFDVVLSDIQKLQIASREANKIGFSFTDKLKNGLSKFSMWFGTTAIFMRSIQAIKGMWNEVVELDTSLVDLQKTTSMTSAELEEFYTRSNTIAKQMGVSTTEIINQASAWSRLGYSTAEASEQMAKLSSQFASISPGMDVDTATDGLVSIMKAFDIDPSNVLDGIMSKVNAIGNTAATSNSEIVDMLERSSSAMASANNTLEQTIALGTSAVEVTRDAAGVGTALKTISMRIRAMDEETGQYDETLGGIVGKIHDLTGVSIMSDTDTYRSTYDILEDISKVWDNLTDKQRAQTLEELFGKRQANVGSAILTNFDAATKAMDTMADSAGSADKEMGIIMDSLEYKINAFKETETGIAQNLFQKDDMKALVDALTKVGEAIEFVTDKLGLFGTIGLGASLFAGIKNVGRGKIVSSRPICLR